MRKALPRTHGFTTLRGSLWSLALAVVLGGLASSSAWVLFPASAVGFSPPAERHMVQTSDRALGQKFLNKGAQLIADYGAFQLFETTQLSADMTNNPASQLRDEYKYIRLNAGPVDTCSAQNQSSYKSHGSFTGKRLQLVQFAGPSLPAWRNQLAATGVRIITYIPHNAYLVYGDAESLDRLADYADKAKEVQYLGDYRDDYKIHPDAQSSYRFGCFLQPEASPYVLQLVADTDTNGGTLDLINRLKLGSILRQEKILGYLNVITRFNAGDLALLAGQPDVISIQPYTAPIKCDERQDILAAGILDGDVPGSPGYLGWLSAHGFTQGQFTNSNFVVDVSDSGIDTGTTSPNHFGLYKFGDTNKASRIVYNRIETTTNNPGSTAAGCDGHGTLNAHIIGGYDNQTNFPHVDGSGYHYGLGVCPFVKMGSSVIFDPDYFTYPNYADLQSEAYGDGARISNNSWGAVASGRYDADAQAYDALVRDAQPAGCTNPAPGNQEMVIVFSSGNRGPDPMTIGSPGTAKNVLTVGNAEGVQALGGADGCSVGDDQADNANEISNNTSRGPCRDGRHKPDLMAPGTHISGGVYQSPCPATNGTAAECFLSDASGICGTSNSLFFPDSQEFFTVSSGSSQAAAAVSGGCALLRQYFINQSSNPPSPAMTKAYLMNAARYMTAVATNDDLWSNSQGMGEVNLGSAFDGVGRALYDQDPGNLFTNTGDYRMFTGTITDTNQPFRVTVAWTDAPGNTTGDAFNNDLDLTVVAGGQYYRGNVFSGSNSITGGSADPRNNVESVFLPAGVSGSYVVVVTAANINSDGVPNNGYPVDQDFALAIYNGSPSLVGPMIYSQPASLTVLAGTNVTFDIGASGSPSLMYQWTHDGTNLVAATDTSLSLTNVQPVDAGDYAVIITNAEGSVTSLVATLIVLVPVSITVDLTNQVVVQGTTVTLSVVADGTAPLDYQWLSWGTNIDGATNATLVLTNIQFAQAGEYQVIITNIVNAVTSAMATVTVLVPPTITSVLVNNSGATLTSSSEPGLNYTLEYKGDIIDPTWTPISPTVPGTGADIYLQDPDPPVTNRFYRIRCE